MATLDPDGEPTESVADISETAPTLSEAHSLLMDLNHEAMQEARVKVGALEVIREKWNEAMDELIDAHIEAAMRMASIAQDVIMSEFNIFGEDEGGEEE